MKKVASLLAVLALVVCVFTGCSVELKDGTYRAEFEEYDSYGWKDYVVIEIEDGKVVSIESDAVDADGNLKSQDESYKKDMESVTGTYPSKYNSDLVNQYMAGGDISNVDIVAGATISTDNFKALVSALSTPMQNGTTDTVLVAYPTH